MHTVDLKYGVSFGVRRGGSVFYETRDSNIIELEFQMPAGQQQELDRLSATTHPLIETSIIVILVPAIGISCKATGNMFARVR